MHPSEDYLTPVKDKGHHTAIFFSRRCGACCVLARHEAHSLDFLLLSIMLLLTFVRHPFISPRFSTVRSSLNISSTPCLPRSAGVWCRTVHHPRGE